ncbi:hypothetical protein D3C72_1418800 [compost metagenome]
MDLSKQFIRRLIATFTRFGALIAFAIRFRSLIKHLRSWKLWRHLTKTFWHMTSMSIAVAVFIEFLYFVVRLFSIGSVLA